MRLNVKSGFTPLHVATFLGHKEVPERLRKHGANPGKLAKKLQA
ncbi:MAG: ankyrin repeat domain-containing protein [Opitutae bacterium]|nr:ankyrin repeat domain-containing protein [Opitutae bacterium]